jgi:hypothetical protein
MVEDRDYFGHQLKKPPKNALSNDCYRGCRKVLGSYTEYSRRDQPHRTSVESIEKLSYEKLWMNTVLSRSLEYPDRLVRLKFVRKGGDGAYTAFPVDVTGENYLNTTFPIDHFCLQEFDPCIVSELECDLQPAMSTLFDLQNKAELHRLTHWKNLPKICLPESWFDRTRDGAPAKVTYDGGCDICSWEPGQGAPSPTPRPLNFAYFRKRHAEKESVIDRKKAFSEGVSDSISAALKHSRGLQRVRDSEVVEDPSPRSQTIDIENYRSSEEVHETDPVKAGRPLKRAKLSGSQNSITDAQSVDEEEVVEIAHATPLKNGIIYKIKFLEGDEEYNGKWDTDTEVDMESDVDTLVDMTAVPAPVSVVILSLAYQILTGVQPIAESGPAIARFPSTAPETPIGPDVRNDSGGVASPIGESWNSAVDDRNTYIPLGAEGFLPVDFIDNSYVRDEGYSRRHSIPVAINTPPDDPFSAPGYFSLFEEFNVQNASNDALSDRLRTEKPDSRWSAQQEQSIFALQNYSAALHSAMGYGPAPPNVAGTTTMSLTPDMSQQETILQTDTLNFDASQSYDYASLTLANGDPSTPQKLGRTGFLSNLMFTDEFNHIQGSETEFQTLSPQSSPLGNFESAQPPSDTAHLTQSLATALSQNPKPRIDSTDHEQEDNS